LIHLDFVTQARKEKANLLFLSNSENKKEFLSAIKSTINSLTKRGIQKEATNNYTHALFEGINHQIYNTPIDLFIEDLIYANYSEYSNFKLNKQPADEYELVKNWAKVLELDKYFSLVSEAIYRADKTDQPLENDSYQEREMFQFQRSQEVIGTNMAVVTYMVDALQYFEKISQDNIKKIAVEIALLGAKGFRPDKKDYTLSSIHDTAFSGYKILAYYYISWKLALPEMLSELQLPYNDEYEVAHAMYAKGKGE
jgi:hypothetical protein